MNNVPLVIGMSPSTEARLSDAAFRSEARTTKALVRAVSPREPNEKSLRDNFDYVNLDNLRLRGSRPYLDPKEAAATLDELFRLGQLEERVVVLLGEAVCAAVAAWFGVPEFRRPDVTNVDHVDGWACTVCAVDHPAWYSTKSEAERKEHEAVILGALRFKPQPTRSAFERARRDDMVEQQRLMAEDAILVEQLEEIEELATEDWRRQDRDEYRHLRDYYEHPTYDPEDYE